MRARVGMGEGESGIGREWAGAGEGESGRE